MAKVMLRVAAPTTGDPVSPTVGDEKMLLSANKPQIDKSFDLRDKLASLVGLGNNINPDDKAALYGDLKRMLGEAKAQKVMNHAFIFNNRADVQKLPIEEKLKSFYNIGSSDPDVMETITKTKNLGYGVVPGFRSSNSSINQNLAGQSSAVAGGSLNPELQKRVMLKVKK